MASACAIPGVFMKVKSAADNVSKQYYKDVMQSSSNYNMALALDRRMRMPFLDSQTGVAQYHTSLSMPRRCRTQGGRHGQLYTYPAKRWRKKKSFFSLEPCVQRVEELETGEADVHHIRAVENPVLARVVEESIETSRDSETSREKWYGYEEMSNISDIPDTEDIEDRHSDSSDYDPTASKKRKKKATIKKGVGRGGRKGQSYEKDPEDKEKPYSCDICGARYKTRPGLTYHLNHAHANKNEREEPEDDRTLSPPPRPLTSSTPVSSESSFAGRRGRSSAATEAEKKDVSRYCDFCLGDEMENKKTGQKEELVSCGDCGRSGHPTCLQFTPNMIISVKKYPWQCIECKSCGLCGTSDNDDQLLFCDDCDRGYHMYCLTPPLTEPPEGSWSCHLCIAEFYDGVKPDGMQ